MKTPVLVTPSAAIGAPPAPAAMPAIGEGLTVARARSAARATASPASAWACSHSSQPMALALARSVSRASLLAVRILPTAAR